MYIAFFVKNIAKSAMLRIRIKMVYWGKISMKMRSLRTEKKKEV
jgi:hypothetical protein